MKVGKLIIDLIRIKVMRANKKSCANFVLDSKYQAKLDIPYNQDNHELHKYDVLYGVGEKKNCCIIDIHGGAYIMGNRKENLRFGTFFLDQGFDFIALDYIPNKGKRTTKELVNDCLDAIVHIFDHLKELNLVNDSFVITGDSAGGHIALLVSEILLDGEFAKNFPQKLPKIDLKAVLVNCPVFDYLHLGETILSKSGTKRLLGNNYNDMELRKLLCPKEHISSLTIPLFVSTNNYDFIRSESLEINKTMENCPIDFKFIDLKTDNPKVGHVHNLIDIDLKESIYINNEMVEFIKKHI